MGPLKASAFEIKCSRRKAPMGTTPLREWRRRSRNEVPWPARSGATPDLILGATGLAVDATMTAPYVVRYANPLLSFCGGREVKERLPGTTPGTRGKRRRDGCSATFVQDLIQRTFFELRGNRTVDRIRSRFCLGAHPE